VRPEDMDYAECDRTLDGILVVSSILNVRSLENTCHVTRSLVAIAHVRFHILMAGLEVPSLNLNGLLAGLLKRYRGSALFRIIPGNGASSDALRSADKQFAPC
jgi:hypothetical protein